MQKKIIPIFVPHQGCPHDCIFCNQKKITGISTDVTAKDVRDIIESYLQTINGVTSVEVAFFGGSFTAIDKEKQEELLSVAYEYKQKGLIDEIRMSTRPDCIDESTLDLVEKYGTSIIELGVQSMDEKVLVDSIRGHDSSVVWKSSALIKSRNIKLGLQMMVGLPSDNEQKCIYTAEQFIKIHPDFVRIYPTIVIRDTGLELNYKKGSYTPFTLDESVDIVKKLLVLFNTNNIEVIRVGLQSTEDISLGREILSGPYHPAFGELVKSRIIRDYIEICVKEYLKVNHKIEKIVVYSANRNISTIIGNKKSNRKYFNTNYNSWYDTIVDEKYVDGIKIFIDDVQYREVLFDEIFNEMLKAYGLV